MLAATKKLSASCLLALVTALLVAYGLSAAIAALASGTTRYVATTGSDSANDRTNSIAPCASVQSAVDQAAPGDEVRVAAGVYTGVQVRPRMDVTDTGVVSQIVYISKSLSIQGGYTTTNSFGVSDPVANPTNLDAQGQGRVLYLTGQISVTATGLRLLQGDASNQGGSFSTSPDTSNAGGALYAITATVLVSASEILSSSAAYGGGIYFRDGTQTVRASRIAGNLSTTRRGGGVWLQNSRTQIDNNLIEGNRANSTGGGGIGMSQSMASLSHNTIQGNDAGPNGLGGGILLLSGDVVTLTSNTINNNSAVSGGGLYGAASTMTLSSNQIVSNSSNSFGTGGGALYYIGGTATLHGNIIISNTTVGISPATIYVEDSPSLITENTIAGNLGDGIAIHYDVGTQILSNTISGNSSGINVGIPSETTIAGNTLNGNGVNFYSGTLTATHNVFNGSGLVQQNGQSTISDNQFMGGPGRGLSINGTFVTLTHNLIYNYNAGFFSAGGLYLSAYNASVSGNLIISNSAQSGGGVSFSGGNVRFENNVIADNQAGPGGSGAGLLASGGSVTFVHNTVARNRGGDGSGVSSYAGPGFQPPTTFVLTNTILVSQAVGITLTAGSTATLNGVLWFNNGANTDGSGLVSAMNEHTGDPAFDIDGYHLTPDSAAIDAGIDAGLITDIDGEVRPLGAAPDLGADEFNPLAPVGSVALSGPTMGVLNTAYVFTATAMPLSAAKPITYVWQATGQSPVTHTLTRTIDSVAFSWTITGNQVISVVASNVGGSANAIYVTTIYIAPSNVAVSGPSSGAVNVGYPFTATVAPISTSQPITYVWQATGQAPLTHTVSSLTDGVTFNWTVSGNMLVTVTAQNAVGTVNASHSIAINVPPSSVAISGPNSGAINTSHAYTATVLPPTVTLPITYVWQATGQVPVTHRLSSISDAIYFNWPVTGTKTITVSATNIAGSVSTVYTTAISVAPGSIVVLGSPYAQLGNSYTPTVEVLPVTTSVPLTFVWQATNQSPLTHTVASIFDAAGFLWNIAGPQVITITAINSVGVISTVHTIPVVVPPTGVQVSGPSSGVLGATYMYTATAIPPTATQPITYVWAASGHLPITHTVASASNSAAFAWNVAGPQIITVTAQNVAGSASSTYAVQVNNPAPVISALSPVSATAGGPTFTLNVTGTNFITASVVRWNGSDRGTTYINGSRLQATIAASDIAVTGTVAITVFNPAPGGGESASLPLVVSNDEHRLYLPLISR